MRPRQRPRPSGHHRRRLHDRDSAALAWRSEPPAPPAPGSNDAVDLEILAAVAAAAVDYLVTDDGRLRGRARRAGLAEFVLPLAEAVQLLRNLSPGPLRSPPAVEHIPSYQLDPADPIFDSLTRCLSGCPRGRRQGHVSCGRSMPPAAGAQSAQSPQLTREQSTSAVSPQ